MKGSVFLRDYFAPPRPSKRQLADWIAAGEVAGQLLPDGPYVDIDRFIGRRPAANTEQKPSGIDLLR